MTTCDQMVLGTAVPVRRVCVLLPFVVCTRTHACYGRVFPHVHMHSQDRHAHVWCVCVLMSDTWYMCAYVMHVRG